MADSTGVPTVGEAPGSGVDHFALGAHEVDTMFAFMRKEVETLDATDDRFLDVCESMTKHGADLFVWLATARTSAWDSKGLTP